jgi:hypothetical protein
VEQPIKDFGVDLWLMVEFGLDDGWNMIYNKDKENKNTKSILSLVVQESCRLRVLLAQLQVMVVYSWIQDEGQGGNHQYMRFYRQYQAESMVRSPLCWCEEEDSGLIYARLPVATYSGSWKKFPKSMLVWYATFRECAYSKLITSMNW